CLVPRPLADGQADPRAVGQSAASARALLDHAVLPPSGGELVRDQARAAVVRPEACLCPCQRLALHVRDRAWRPERGWRRRRWRWRWRWWRRRWRRWRRWRWWRRRWRR